MENCVNCKPCCYKLLTVHEIGIGEIGHVTPDKMNYVVCPPHFIKFNEPKKREIMASAIKEISSFDLPVLSFAKTYIRKWYIFSFEKWTWRKTDSARGCIITLLDGSTIFTKEMEYEVRSMIEN